ncbi:hypothetical protein EJ08DRAFT_575722, partial [Tothia fuscella]
LHRADGSATYSYNGYTVLGAVNGPIEVQRRDELPEEAAIEVNVRPASGVGSTKERHLETIIHSALRRVILTQNFPRTLIQLTVQIISCPEPAAPGKYTHITSSVLAVLPALLQTSLLALLSASIPLDTTYTTTSVQLDRSMHVFAFTAERKLLVAESEGDFEYEAWDELCQKAEEECVALQE